MKIQPFVKTDRRRNGGFFVLRSVIIGSGAVALGAWLAPMATTLQAPGGVPEYTGSQKDYLRVTKDAEGEASALQTSIVRLVPKDKSDGTLVDLISAVHVGDPSYYRTLDRQLEQYDAVLYELVAPEGAVLPPSRLSSDVPQDPLAFLMAAGKRLFNFHGQLESMNYQRPNFVHADLSPSGMMQAMNARGDNGLTVALSAAAEILRTVNVQGQSLQNGGAAGTPAGAIDQADILSLFTDPNAPVKFKRLLAQQFDSSDVSTSLGQTLSTILIDDRNKEVVRVLNEQLAQGKKRVAIFYGAAHMPDMEKRVMDLFNMKRGTWHWLTAWDLRMPGAESQPLLQVGG